VNGITFAGVAVVLALALPDALLEEVPPTIPYAPPATAIAAAPAAIDLVSFRENIS
jgi:hypothetical protein